VEKTVEKAGDVKVKEILSQIKVNRNIRRSPGTKRIAFSTSISRSRRILRSWRWKGHGIRLI
jgi:hypothetical protein